MDPFSEQGFYYYFFNLLAMPRAMWDLSSPDQGWNLSPLHWKHEVLTTGPPGKAQNKVFKSIK